MATWLVQSVKIRYGPYRQMREIEKMVGSAHPTFYGQPSFCFS